MVLHVCKGFWPEVGGIETAIGQYAKAAQSEGKELTILSISRRWRLRTQVETIKGARVYRCASLGTFFSMPVSLVFLFYLFFLGRKAELIHLHEPFPLGTLGALMLPRKIPLVISWHSDIFRQKRLRPIFEFFQHKLCRRALGVAVGSTFLLEASRVLPAHRDKVQVVPYCADTPPKITPEDKAELGPLPDTYVLYFGRLVYYKGLSVFLDAASRLPKTIQIVIAGDGPMRQEVARRIEKMDRTITFLPRRLDEPAKHALLSHCRMLVLPSIYESETFGIVQLEAMMYAKPVINTLLKTGPSWVSRHNETGLSVEPSNPQALAEAIESLYFDTDRCDQLGLSAQQRVASHFSYACMKEALWMLYGFSREHR